jgi:glyoxylase-like metal-dependent hydrolase (beta-lactamase superfamily II)
MMRHQHSHHHHHDSNHNHLQPPSRLSRREMLFGLGAASLAAAFARPSLASLIQPAPEPMPQAAGASLFRIEKVSDSVYAALARPAAIANCNAAFIVGSDEVVVVDAHSKPSAAQALINQIRAEVTDKPVRYVINTHFHWDHSQGNAAYPNAFGGKTDIISSAPTREWLAREAVPRLRQQLDSMPRQISDLKTQLAAAKTDAERATLNDRIAQLEAYLKEMTPPDKQIALPTLTFDKELVVYSGGREIRLLFLGRGHTSGDVIAYVPSERVIASGDLMISTLPYMADAYPDEWPRTITALEHLDFNRVAPGHGGVQQGKSVLAFFRSYLEDLNEAVTRGIERGTSLEELQRTVTPDRLRSLTTTDGAARLEREFTRFAAVDAAAAIRRSVAANISDVYNYYTKRR